MHDAAALKFSRIYGKGMQKMEPFLPVAIVLGDSAYPLCDWLLVPYKSRWNMTTQEQHFNYWHSRTRIEIERCFGILKQRWLKQVDAVTEFAPLVFFAACVLHNLCLRWRLARDVDDVEAAVRCCCRGVSTAHVPKLLLLSE